MNDKKNSHLGKKILYSLVIGMSGLVMLINLVGAIGVWVAGRALGDVAISALTVVGNSASVIQTSTARVDGNLEALQVKTTDIAEAANQIGANVSDQGLVLVVLPEEKEKQLIENANEVRDSFAAAKASFSSASDLYHSIDAIPLVGLPGMSEDQIQKLESSVNQTQALAETLRSEIVDFRANTSSKIDKVGGAATQLSAGVLNARDAVAQVGSRMADLEESALHMQQVIVNALTIIAVILTLLFAFVIYTQVEVIRLFVARWRLLDQVTEPIDV